jgi:hypothetical protein
MKVSANQTQELTIIWTRSFDDVFFFQPIKTKSYGFARSEQMYRSVRPFVEC